MKHSIHGLMTVFAVAFCSNLNAAVIFESQQRYVEVLAIAGPSQDQRHESTTRFGYFGSDLTVDVFGELGSCAGSRSSQISNIEPGCIIASGWSILGASGGNPIYDPPETAQVSFKNVFDLEFSVTDMPQVFNCHLWSRGCDASLKNLNMGQNILDSNDFGYPFSFSQITLAPGRYELYLCDSLSQSCDPISGNYISMGESDRYEVMLTYDVTATPEPSAILLWLMLGAFGLIYAWQRRKSS